jgi:hypothetical protein
MSSGEDDLIGTAIGLVRTDACPPPWGASPTKAPHFGQYAKSGAHGKPQAKHAFGCFVPHFGQKAKPL